MGTRNFAEYNPGAAELGRKNQPGGYVGYGGGLYPFSASSLTIAPGTSVIPANNGEITLDLPNKSRLRFSAKGDDGQVRWFLPARYNHATNSLAIGDVGEVFHNGLQEQACWNATIIGQLACSGIGVPGVDFITDTVVIGTYAGNKFKHGNGNAICGNRSMQDIVDSQHNTAYGDSAWRFATTVADGTAVGYCAGQEVRSGSFDVVIGSYAACYATSSERNIFIGGYAGARSLSPAGGIGAYNIGIGSQAMRYAAATSVNNVGIGTESLFQCIGTKNVAIGYQSGMKLTDAAATQNVNIGYLAGGVTGFQKADSVNSICIGYNTYNTASNQVVLGNGSIAETILRGNVTGIGGIDLSANWTGTGPTNGSMWRASSILFITAATVGLQINNAANTKAILKLDDNGSLFQYPPSAVTPTINGQMTFEATSNTTLTVKLRGTDGTVRSATLPLT